jgi:rRNA small subunit pseudouridine methyltransferase Nep1
MFSLILAESSLELVPQELKNHPSVISHARKLGKVPSKILLDNSWHFAAMKGISNELKRGRPDLVHFSILESTTIPLFLKNKMNLYVHTIDDKVIRFSNDVHIPKSYHRFQGLIEKLFQEKKITSNNNELLSIKEQSFSELLNSINPSQTIGLSTVGMSTSYEKLASVIDQDTCVVVGGFQKSHFSESITKSFSKIYSVGNESFEGHTVVSRILYEYEKTIFM